MRPIPFQRPAARGTVTLTLAAVMALAGCASSQQAGAPRAGAASQAPLSAAEIAAIIASPDRRPADLTNDIRRKPAQLLSFMGVRRGMTALDLSAGGGYTSELLARAAGPTGKVYAQVAPRADGPPPSFATLSERASGLANANITPVLLPYDRPVAADMPAGTLDLVTLMFNYHDLGHMGVDRAAMNRAVFNALRPGGAFVVADHAGRPGTGISEGGTLHRVEEAFVRQELEAAGFRLAGSADFLRNPADPRERIVPEGGQPKDEFVLRFVRP